jgi:predicted esterase/thiol-disulfide isomerase/thioredoxin
MLCALALAAVLENKIDVALTSKSPTADEALRWSPKGAKLELTRDGSALVGSLRLGPPELAPLAVKLDKSTGAAHFDVLWLDFNRDGVLADAERLTTQPNESRGKFWSSFESEIVLAVPSSAPAQTRSYPLSLWFVEDPQEPDAQPVLRWSRRGWHEGECVIDGRPAFVLVTEMELDGVFDQRDAWFLARERSKLLGASSRSLEQHTWLDDRAYRPVAIDPHGRSIAFERFEPGFTEADETAKADTLAPDRNAPRAARPLEFSGDLAAALDTAKQSGMRVLVDFETAWCGPCATMNQLVYTSLPVVRAAANVIAVKLDGDVQRELVKQYAVGAYPTIVLLSSDGKELRRAVGYQSVAQMVEFLSPPEVAPVLNMRFEVLSRVRDFERSWISERDPAKRAAALQVLENVSANCIAAASGECARTIDRAQWALTAERSPRAYSQVGLAVSQRLCDRESSATHMRAPLIYGDGSFALISVNLSLAWWSRTDVSTSDDSIATTDVVKPVRLIFDRAAVGDTTLTAHLSDGGFPHAITKFTLSIVERRDERLAALTQAIEAATEMGPQLELATARMQLALLESLARGSTEVHEYPGARLLTETEAVVTAALNGQRWYGPERTGEYWLALPCGATTVRTRVLVPEGLSKESPAPLVLALHGAVFDEDTWFDGYGGGQSAELARQRGWLFAAPHCEGTEDAAWLAALVQALSDVYPLDASRVALIGHDRGGVSALKALAQAPAPWRAVAAMAAWIDSSEAKQLAARPLFLGVGEHDSLRAAVGALHTGLEAAGAKDATLRTYAHTDRWLCPVDALPDVFAWLDVRLK